MRVRVADLKLAIEQIPVGTESVVIQFGTTIYSKFEISYDDANKKLTTIALYDASTAITPEITQVSRLYKKV